MRASTAYGITAVTALFALTACGGGSHGPESATTTASATCQPITVTATPATGGSTQGGPGGGGATVTPVATYALRSGSATKAGTTIAAPAANTSGVLVTTKAQLTLTDVTVRTSGNSSSTDESSFYGLDAGVLATTGATLTMNRGSVTTSGTGANGVFASGTGTKAILCGVTIRATGGAAHGIMASGGGSISARDLDVSTTGSNAAAIATDRGGGTIAAAGGRYATAGVDAPGLYSTGALLVTAATVTATGSEVAVIEGSNSIVATDATMSGAKKSGVMILQTMSGDSSGSHGIFTMTGGSLTQAAGPLLFVTNATGAITLTGVAVKAKSGTLLKAAADRWGSGGSNGGHATLRASDESLDGDVVVDRLSDAAITLTGRSSLTGAIDTASTAKSVTLSLGASSTWVVTADSHLTVLSDARGITGSRITNIYGNGHTVRYDAARNPALGGKTYTLAGAGTLRPA